MDANQSMNSIVPVVHYSPDMVADQTSKGTNYKFPKKMVVDSVGYYHGDCWFLQGEAWKAFSTRRALFIDTIRSHDSVSEALNTALEKLYMQKEWLGYEPEPIWHAQNEFATITQARADLDAWYEAVAKFKHYPFAVRLITSMEKMKRLEKAMSPSKTLPPLPVSSPSSKVDTKEDAVGDQKMGNDSDGGDEGEVEEPTKEEDKPEKAAITTITSTTLLSSSNHSSFNTLWYDLGFDLANKINLRSIDLASAQAKLAGLLTAFRAADDDLMAQLAAKEQGEWPVWEALMKARHFNLLGYKAQIATVWRTEVFEPNQELGWEIEAVMADYGRIAKTVALGRTTGLVSCGMVVNDPRLRALRNDEELARLVQREYDVVERSDVPPPQPQEESADKDDQGQQQAQQ